MANEHCTRPRAPPAGRIGSGRKPEHASADPSRASDPCLAPGGSEPPWHVDRAADESGSRTSLQAALLSAELEELPARPTHPDQWSPVLSEHTHPLRPRSTTWTGVKPAPTTTSRSSSRCAASTHLRGAEPHDCTSRISRPPQGGLFCVLGLLGLPGPPPWTQNATRRSSSGGLVAVRAGKSKETRASQGWSLQEEDV
jgi:hypothetical protein